jgi:hypothetical protein
MTPAMSRKATAWLPAILAALFALLPAMRAEAAGVRLDVAPSLRLEEGWRSNVGSASDDEVSSFGTRVAPSLGFTLHAPDDVRVRLLGTYERMWYHDDDAKSSEFNTWNVRVDSTGAWRFTPTFSVQPSVYFINTVDSYRRLELLPSGDPVLPDVTVLDYRDTRTQNFGGTLVFSYEVSPKLSIDMRGNYSEKRFKEEDAGEEGLTNNTQAGGGLGFDYAVSPQTTVGLIASGSHNTYDDGADSDVYTAGIRYGYRFSPTVKFNVTAGASHVRRESVTGVSESDSDTAPSGSFRLTYDSETFAAVFYGSAAYSGSSGFRDTTKQYTGGLNLRKDFARTFSGTISGYYQLSKSAFEENAVDIHTVHGAVEFRYQPWEIVSLYLNGSAHRQESDGQYGRTIDNYSANLGITITNAYNIF